MTRQEQELVSMEDAIKTARRVLGEWLFPEMPGCFSNDTVTDGDVVSILATSYMPRGVYTQFVQDVIDMIDKAYEEEDGDIVDKIRHLCHQRYKDAWSSAQLERITKG